MGVYANADDVYKYMGRVFEMAFEDNDLAEKLYATKVSMRLNYSDPESTISVDWGKGVVECGEATSITPDVDLYMSVDTAHKFWLGKLNVPVAMAKGQIKTKGSTAKVLKVAPLLKPMFAKYEQILKDAGLESLISV